MEGVLPPGFRFYPTDEELVIHYLFKKASYQAFSLPIIAEVDLYKFNPWELPEKAFFGEKEWYFFSQREKKYPNGTRPNRAAASGYWKATGTDKSINLSSSNGRVFPAKIGVKKSLVFYKGKAPNGVKTNWIMHEYRLANSRINKNQQAAKSSQLDEWVVCRIYKKKGREEAHKTEEKSEKMTENVSGVRYDEPNDAIQGAGLEMPCQGVGFSLEDCLPPLNTHQLPTFPQEILRSW